MKGNHEVTVSVINRTFKLAFSWCMLCVCLCVHVCICMYVHGKVHMHMSAHACGGQKLCQLCSTVASTSFLRQSLSLTLELVDSARQESQPAPEICLCLPTPCWDYSYAWRLLDFIWILGIQTEVLWQALYPISHLLSPKANVYIL